MSSTASSSQLISNQGLFVDHQEMLKPMSFFSFPPNASLTNSSTVAPSVSADPHIPTLSPSGFLLSSASFLKQQTQDTFTITLQKQSENLSRIRGEVDDECMISNKRSRAQEERLGMSPMKMKKKIKGRRKVREPRFSFKTMSDVDVLDDGYKWRKYGQKVVKSTQHPRSYYRCTQDNCRVKKRVERMAEDPRMVITTYEGRHAHSPSHDEDDSHPSNSQINNLFW
ncbi:hypothetical protein NMG60_11017031 [Bertholletia excelsa]